MLTEFKAGFIKRANEAGLSGEDANALYNQVGQGLSEEDIAEALAAQGGGEAGAAEAGLAGEEDGVLDNLSEEDLQVLAQQVAQVLAEHGQGLDGEAGKIASEVADPDYVGGFLKQSMACGLNAVESLNLLEQGFCAAIGKVSGR